MLSPDGGETRVLEGVNEGYAAAFSSDGRFAAAAAGIMGVEERRIVIWDVSSGEKLHVFEVGEMVRLGLHFTSDGHLLSASESGLLKWNMETEEQELLYEGDIVNFAANDDGERVLMVVGGESSLRGRVVLLDLETDTVTRLDQFGDDVMYVALDKTGRIAAAGDRDGEVRVGLVSGGQAHLFVGHEGSIWSVAIDPLGRWVASGSDDHTLRLWPMPDLDEPPLHTLPREELIAKLKTLTNLRVVRDEESPTGWKLDVGPFPGWETVPTW
jgi:WD40 repeat protein